MDSKTVSIPNIFYDLIVFVSPSILLITGLIIGLNGFPITYVIDNKINIGAINFIFILFFFIFIGYEYGRLIEAISSILVSKPLKFLHKHKIFLNNPDFKIKLYKEYEALNLYKIEESEQNGGRWGIMFHASLVAPHIGLDLLKRYAWEKLSRSSALTFLILFITSIIFHYYRPSGLEQLVPNEWIFSSWSYTISVGILCMTTYYEYYQRNSWNNDLLKKILPILILAEEMKSTNNQNITQLASTNSLSD